MLIFKVVPRAEWEAAGEDYRGSAHDQADGFLHFSTAPQLATTLRLYYAGQDDLLLIAVEADRLGAALKYGGPNVTIDAYQSVQLLIVWFTAMHLLLAVIVGVLLGGRLLRGRLKGQEFLVSTTGYWWYYTIIAGLLLWIFGMLL